jgi:thiamine-monophosphate kinase
LRTRKDIGEQSVLERIRRAFDARGGGRFGKVRGGEFVSLGIGDDAALVRPGRGREIVLTCDWFLEGTHFLRDKHPADSVGWKCLARAVSDVAAMGGVPRCFLLSLALPKDLAAGAWLGEFLGGLRRGASRFGCELAGGDTTERCEVLIHVTVIGEVLRGRAVRRAGARVGDVIYVSGQLGEAELGLRLLRSGKRLNDARLRKHLYPEPPVELGRWLSERRLATAMMDLSDGLSTDLGRLCGASGVGARVEGERLPVIHGSRDALELALHGGDDYELLFTVAKRDVRRVPRAMGGVKITAIGEITRGREVMVVDESGRRQLLKAGGWDPFCRLSAVKNSTLKSP